MPAAICFDERPENRAAAAVSVEPGRVGRPENMVTKALTMIKETLPNSFFCYAKPIG
jgi:hypothetical protein